MYVCSYVGHCVMAELYFLIGFIAGCGNSFLPENPLRLVSGSFMPGASLNSSKFPLISRPLIFAGVNGRFRVYASVCMYARQSPCRFLTLLKF